MSDDALRRFSSGDDAVLARLARSARLDRPKPGARERALERLLSEPRGPRRTARSTAAFGALAGLCAGAAAAYFAAARPPAAESPLAVTPEPARVAFATPAEERSAAPPAEAPRSTASSPAPSLPPCPRVAVAAGEAPLIDDFEDGNARLFPAEGRRGTWRANAPLGTLLSPPPGSLAFPSPIPGGRGDSKYALRFSAPRIKQGSASIVADLAPMRCYDASVYGGVEFLARGKTRVEFRVTSIDSMEKRWGGLCEENCYDAHAKAIELGPEFVRYRIRWEDLEQAGYGRALPFDARRIFLMDFTVDAADSPFDVWIDDLRFFTR